MLIKNVSTYEMRIGVLSAANTLLTEEVPTFI